MADPERTCIVTRKALPPKKMIRFVVGPDQQLVPDIKAKLPGRGVWVSNARSMVETAMAKKLFARGLKQGISVPENLPDMVDNMLSSAAIGALGMAKRAGACLTGADNVDKKIRSGRTVMALHATDGAEDGLRKLHQAAYASQMLTGKEVPVYRVWSSDQMNLALGATNVIHAALNDSGAALNCLSAVKRLAKYREMEPS